MQRCPVCGKEGADFIICPDCGFDESLHYEQYLSLAPLPEGKVLSVRARQAEWERRQRRARLDEVQILLETYYYNVEDEGLSLARTQEICVAEGGSLKDGEITWSTVEFPRIDDMDQLPITLFVRHGETRRRCRVVVDNPGGGKVWNVGVRLLAGEHPAAELTVGTKDEYSCSDRFSLEV